MMLIKLFTAPTEVFHTLIERNNWKNSLFPLGLLIVAGVMNLYFIQDLVIDVQMENAITRIEESTRVPEEQKEEFINDIYDRVENQSAMTQVMSWVMAGISTPLRILFFSLIALLAGNLLLGGRASYPGVFTITSYAYLVIITELIIKTPLMLNKWSIEVYTGFGLLGIGEPGSFLQLFIAGIDLFAVWRIVLISIGMGILYKKGTKQVFFALTGMWVILLLVQSGFASVLN